MIFKMVTPMYIKKRSVLHKNAVVSKKKTRTCWESNYARGQSNKLLPSLDGNFIARRGKKEQREYYPGPNLHQQIGTG